MVAADAAADGLVAGSLHNLFADKRVVCVPVERDRFSLNFRCVEFHPESLAPPAFLFGEIEHPSGDASTPRIGIDIHAAQLHGVRAGCLEPEHADNTSAVICHPEAATALRIVIGDPVDL